MVYLQNTAARRVTAMAFSYDGYKLFAGGDGGFDLWDLATQTQAFTKGRINSRDWGVQFDPLGRWVYYTSPNFHLIPLQNQAVPPLPGSPHERHIISFDIARDQGCLYLTRGGIINNRMECWDSQEDGSFLLRWAMHGDTEFKYNQSNAVDPAGWMTSEVATDNSGTTLVSSRTTLPFFVTQHDVQTGRPIRNFARGSRVDYFMAKLALSPNGKTLLTWDGDQIEHWDVASGRLTHVQGKPGASKYWGVEFHPSGKQILAASGDGQVRILNAEDFSLEASMKWNIGKLASLAISPDGTKAAVGGEKGKVCLWDLE